MGMFGGIANTPANQQGGNYIRPGHYIMRLDRVKAGTSQQGSGDFVAIEMTTLSISLSFWVTQIADFSAPRPVWAIHRIFSFSFSC